MFDFDNIDVCVYHKDCCDGFCSALIVHNECLTRDIKYIEATHNMIVEDVYPEITGKNVLIVDFAFKRDVLLKMFDMAESILVVDHHKTSMDDLNGLPFAIFDMTKSGAGLLWDTMNPNSRRPKIVDYVEDRDLWNWKLPNSKDVNAVIQTTPFDFDTWNSLDEAIEWDLKTVVNNGRFINICKNDLCEQVAKQSQLVKFDYMGTMVRVINVGVAGLISDSCNTVLESYDDADVVCAYTVFPDGHRLYSLRSRPSFDCSVIAKYYGGGGHPQACGFRNKKEEGFPWKILP